MVYETWASYSDKVKRYFGFSIEEKRDFLISMIFLGFVYSFREWGYGSEFDAAVGLTNLVLTSLIGAIAVFVHVGAQRLHALRLGYKPEFIMWPYGIIGGIIICILTNGVVVIPLYGGVSLHMMNKHRIGHFRYGLNQVNIGLVAFVGPIANLLFAYLIKIMNHAVASPFLEKMILINLLIAVWTTLPIPPHIDGAKIFFWSRISYAFMLGVIGSAALMIWFTDNLFYIFFGSLAIGGILWLVYYLTYEETGFNV